MTCEEYAKYKHNKRQLEYYYANHEKMKEYCRMKSREYYAKNKEKILERLRNKRHEKMACSNAANADVIDTGNGA